MQKLCDNEDKHVYFNLFADYDLNRDQQDTTITYATLAGKYNLSAETVTNYLAWTRREFRRIVLDTIRQMTSTEEEFREEVRTVLGVDAT